MMKQIATAALCLSAWIGCVVPVAAQEAELTSRDILRALQARMDMDEWSNPMTLKEVLGLVHEKVATQGLLGKGIGLPILIDVQGFIEVNPESGDIYEAAVKFPPYPKKMPLASMLQIALSQIPTGDAAYVIRRGAVIITPAKRTQMGVMLKQKILANFERRPLEEVVHDLAEQTGVSIQLDSRALKDKQNVQVTALFRNDTSLRDALLIVADMAGLQVVELPTAVYITSPASAEALRKTAEKK